MNRVGPTWSDQLDRSGHDRRLGDLDRFAELGLQVLRYPVLWERVAPDGLERSNWEASDAGLDRLGQLNVDPVVGLLHHGTGPAEHSLLELAWPLQLAEYAAAVATRYPWVTAFTPVNEPLTTARFSALYGHWYPHRADDRAFARALVNQVKAIALAMRRIRAITPEARLIQTEDLAWITASSGELAYQAAFENERRWVTLDLLTGCLEPGMVMYAWLLGQGIRATELDWFREFPTPPDIVGWNYYVLSERHLVLDEHSRGGNGRHRYRDCDAARSCGLRGLQRLLAEAHDRFRLPMAVTECHLSGTRDEQLRWLVESWEATRAAQQDGVDLRGFTVWSLLGAFDWDSLCVRGRNRYEPGVFDLRGPVPRPTALAAAVQDLVRGVRPDHPVLDAPGWWHQ